MKDGVYQIVNRDTELVLMISSNAANGSNLTLAKFQRRESEFRVAGREGRLYTLTVVRDGTTLSARILDSSSVPKARSGRPGTLQIIPISIPLKWFIITDHTRSQYIGIDENSRLTLSSGRTSGSVWKFMFQRSLRGSGGSSNPKPRSQSQDQAQMAAITAQLEALQLANKNQQSFNDAALAMLANQQKMIQKMGKLLENQGPPPSNPRRITGPKSDDSDDEGNDKVSNSNSDDDDPPLAPKKPTKPKKKGAPTKKGVKPRRAQKGRKGP